MRLFVAVDLPDAVRQSAAAAAGRLREQLARARTPSRIAWVSGHVLHLTLVFLGEIDDATAAHVIERLRPPLALRPFALGLGPAGMFPAAGRPRVLWLAVTEGAAALDGVRSVIEARLEGVPYSRDGRPFSPHLTLGRFRDGGTLDDRRAVAETTIAPSRTAIVDRVTLYQSRLTPRGPEHAALAVSSLAHEELA
jgi:2'-5' RNA ligase